jgi:hypothetical protein
VSVLFTREGNVRYWPTAVVACTTPFVVSAKSQYGVLTYKSSDVIALVLPIAGTIVALALPAAQLAQAALVDFLATANNLVAAKQPIPEVYEYLSKRATKQRRDLQATRCVVIYGLASFLVAIVGCLGFLNDVRFGDRLGCRDFIACFSVILLVVAVLWFVPVVVSAFSFLEGDELMRRLADMAKKAGQQAPATSESKGSPMASPPAQEASVEFAQKKYPI